MDLNLTNDRGEMFIPGFPGQVGCMINGLGRGYRFEGRHHRLKTAL